MKKYNYEDIYQDLLTPNIVSLLTTIHEFKGEQKLFIEANTDKLVELMEIAKIQSTDASNKIEGIYTSNDRLKQIVMDKTMPRTRNEKEIAGYRDVLNTIHNNYDYISIRPRFILQLHGDLYKFTGSLVGGKFKSINNIIEEEDDHGNKFVRFKPIEAWMTPNAMDELCDAYNDAISKGIDPLLIIPMFIIDFLCIHPFSDGNGRMSRLLTLLLLYKADYIVGKYISIEKLIETTKETYYETLQQSSINWHDNSNYYVTFVEYYLGIIVAAYKDFSNRVQTLVMSGTTKQERVREVIRNHIGKITKTEIAKMCPDISNITIQRTLAELLENKEIIKIGGGRYTSYLWNEEKE